MKVRDEEDILALNLQYHRGRGVDHFVVTDNGSSDRTPDILRTWQGAGRLELISEPGEDFRESAHGWVTRMARRAAIELEADWVLYADADEFWWPMRGDLKSALGSIDERYGVVVAPRPEFVARPAGAEPFFERMRIRERFSRIRPKVAHRAAQDAVLHEGAHGVDVERADGVRRGDRAVLRGVKPARPEEDGRLVWAPRFPLRVLHFPIRSFEQFRRRVEVTLFRTGWTGGGETHRKLLEHFEADRLDELYRQLVVDDRQVEAGIADGRLVLEGTVGEALACCEEQLNGADELRLPPGAASQSELAELELDAMRTISCAERDLIRQVDALRERLNERRRRQARNRRWDRRLRKRAGRVLGRR